MLLKYAVSRNNKKAPSKDSSLIMTVHYKILCFDIWSLILLSTSEVTS